jgi:endonuclease/exonuclease/phosphatase family metal-dependent hydrolase
MQPTLWNGADLHVQYELTAANATRSNRRVIGSSPIGGAPLRLCSAISQAGTLGWPDGVPPVVLAADLNARPDTPEFAALTEVIIGAWAAARPGERGHTPARANRWVAADEWLADGRIDHVLVRSGSPAYPVSVTSADLAGTTDPPPSDHHAVVVGLAWSDHDASA